MKKKTAKRVVKTPDLARDEYQDSVASTGQPRYYPELADNWLPAGFYDEDIKGNSFLIREDSPDANGPWIATITVNPAFSPENQRRLAWFLTMAPQLWRALQEAAAYLPASIEACGALKQATTTLWESAYRFPFGEPMPSPREKSIYVDCNKAVMRRLGSKRKAVAALQANR